MKYATFSFIALFLTSLVLLGFPPASHAQGNGKITGWAM